MITELTRGVNKVTAIQHEDVNGKPTGNLYIYWAINDEEAVCMSRNYETWEAARGYVEHLLNYVPIAE